MNARLPALLLCGALSAAISSVVTLLMVESPEAPGAKLGTSPPADDRVRAMRGRLDALSRDLEDLRGRQPVQVSRTPVGGLATKAELHALAKRIEALAEGIKELQRSDRQASLVESLSTRVLAATRGAAATAERERILENRAERYGLDETQVARMRELEETWDMRDRDLLLMCQGASASVVVDAIGRSENEYQAAFEAILTPDQREKRREITKKYGRDFVSRYRD